MASRARVMMGSGNSCRGGAPVGNRAPAARARLAGLLGGDDAGQRTARGAQSVLAAGAEKPRFEFTQRPDVVAAQAQASRPASIPFRPVSASGNARRKCAVIARDLPQAIGGKTQSGLVGAAITDHQPRAAAAVDAAHGRTDRVRRGKSPAANARRAFGFRPRSARASSNRTN